MIEMGLPIRLGQTDTSVSSGMIDTGVTVNRTVGICKGLVRLVDVDNGRFETPRLKTRFTVTIWVLNKIKTPAEWVKVAVPSG